MINTNFTKFPYKKIEKIDTPDGRFYLVGDQKLPSVTTILDATKPEDSKQALDNWRNRIGHQEADSITKIAANRGSIIHNILENWIHNKDYDPGNNMIHREAKRMASTIQKNIESDIDEAWGTEIQLYYPGLYAGTSDLVGVYKGKDAIMDFKQSNRVKKREWITDYFLQVAAYGTAHNMMYGTDIKTAVIFMACVNNTFLKFELDESEFEKYSVEWANRIMTHMS